jgi:hypothetical protein
MAYRHLLLLGESDTGGAKLDHIDLGPARATATITGRVLEYLRSADRIIETTLAPAALLAARFGLLPEGTNATEVEALLGFFYRLPRLPKLANPGVLRRALAEGVEKGLFGLASGSAWDAEDAVLRFAQTVDPSEIQFQPGTWLVRAATIKELLAKRAANEPPTAPRPEPETPGPERPDSTSSTRGESGDGTPKPAPPASGPLPGVTIHVKGVPAESQLATARAMQQEFGIYFPLILGDAERLPFDSGRFDLAISEYGASLWCDPYRWIPEAARVLKPGGHLAFLLRSPLFALCMPASGQVSTTLFRPQFGLRELDHGSYAEFTLPHGEMLRLLREQHFTVEDLIEIQAPRPAHRDYAEVSADWAQRWPSEEI